MAVFAKHGFREVVERIKLGRYILSMVTSDEVATLTTEERLRLSFEELGPTFVKFGQLMASRPDMIPETLIAEFSKLHDQVPGLAWGEIKKVIETELGTAIGEVFSDFNEQPLAAASIAQVHRATLKSGQQVVVKVQRPGIRGIIENDIGVLYQLAGLLEKYIPEVRVFNVVGIVDEFCRTLELETNFLVEGNNIRRFIANFGENSEVVIPHVYLNLSTPKLLVLDFIDGVPLSNKTCLAQEGVDREILFRIAFRSFLKMVFRDGLFHGDLHAGNLIVLPENKVGLIDFGAVGRLNRKTQNIIANMLVALATEDYEQLAFEYVELAPFNERTDVDKFARDLRDLIAPYHGLTLREFSAGRLLMDSTAIAGRHSLTVPSELILFFRSLMQLEGIGRSIKEEFDFFAVASEFVTELLSDRYDPSRVVKNVAHTGKEMASLLAILPRQVKFFIRKINSPDHAFTVKIGQFPELRHSLETSFNLLFLGLIMGSIILSSSILLLIERGPQWGGVSVFSLIGYGLAAVLGIVAFFNYIKK